MDQRPQLSAGTSRNGTLQLFNILKAAGVPVELKNTQNAVFVNNGESSTIITVLTYQEPNTPMKSSPLSLT